MSEYGAQAMKSRESLIRLHRFQVDEKRRQVAEIEAMIADFARKESELDEQIKVEQQRSGISDESHFAYPMFAKAARQRRDNLRASVEELQGRLDAAKADLSEAFAELKKFELMEERELARERQEMEAREQAELDEVGLNMHRRGAV